MNEQAWISVNDLMPQILVEVLVVKHFIDSEFDMENGGYTNKEFKTEPAIYLDSYCGNHWIKGGINTHWMPLPEIEGISIV